MPEIHDHAAAYVAAIARRVGLPVDEQLIISLPPVSLPDIPDPSVVASATPPEVSDEHLQPLSSVEEPPPLPACPPGPDGTGLTGEHVLALLSAMSREKDATTKGISNRVVRGALESIPARADNQVIAALCDWFTVSGIIGQPEHPDPENEPWRRPRLLLVTDLPTMAARLREEPEENTAVQAARAAIEPQDQEQQERAAEPRQEQKPAAAPEPQEQAPGPDPEPAPEPLSAFPAEPRQEQKPAAAPEPQEQAPEPAPQDEPLLDFPPALVGEDITLEHLHAIFDALILEPEGKITSKTIREALAGRYPFPDFRKLKAKDLAPILTILLEWLVGQGVLDGPATPDSPDTPWRSPRTLLVSSKEELLARLQDGKDPHNGL